MEDMGWELAVAPDEHLGCEWTTQREHRNLGSA